MDQAKIETIRQRIINNTLSTNLSESDITSVALAMITISEKDFFHDYDVTTEQLSRTVNAQLIGSKKTDVSVCKPLFLEEYEYICMEKDIPGQGRLILVRSKKHVPVLVIECKKDVNFNNLAKQLLMGYMTSVGYPYGILLSEKRILRYTLQGEQGAVPVVLEPENLVGVLTDTLIWIKEIPSPFAS